MTIQEAIEHGKEQLDVFGGEHKEFIEIAIRSLEAWHKIYKQIKTEINPYGKPTKDYDTGCWVLGLIDGAVPKIEKGGSE